MPGRSHIIPANMRLQKAMRHRLLFAVLLLTSAAIAFAQNPQNPLLVETVEVSGISEDLLSTGLRDDLQRLQGQPYNEETANRLADRIQAELPDQVAAQRTLPGAQADRVRLIFAVAPVGVIQYRVESVRIEGVPPMAVSSALQTEIQKTAGQMLSKADAERLRAALASELGSKFGVTWRTISGTAPMQVLVVYEAYRIPWVPFRGPTSFLTYHQKLGLSGAIGIPLWSNHPRKSKLVRSVPGVHVKRSSGNAASDTELPRSPMQPDPTRTLTFGFANSGDELVERYKGIWTALEWLNVGSERLGLRLEYSGFGTRWKGQTLSSSSSLPDYDLYRARHTLEPSLAFGITRNLYTAIGIQWVDLDMQYPATGSRSASAAIGSLRYRQEFKSDGVSHEVGAGYEVHSSAHSLDSDFIYARHFWDGSYTYRRDNSSVRLKVMAGRVTGAAPMFERFSIGNTETLRGWNKFDFAPRGGDRLVHGSLEYGRSLPMRRSGQGDLQGRVFYDSGTVWNAGDSVKLRSSIGLGIGTKDRAVLILGFRIQGTHLSPALMLTLR
jgi:hypothetical protein